MMERASLPRDLVSQSPPATAVNINKRFFTTEDFLDMYENITDMLDVSTGYFFAQIHKWAEVTDHSSQEWIEFFNSEVLAVHNNHLGQKEWQQGQVPQTPILTAAREYIQAHPQMRFPGWAAIAEHSTSSPGEKRSRKEGTPAEVSSERTTASPAKKRAREEEAVTQSPVKVTEEANVKRQRVERTLPESSAAPFPDRIIEEEMVDEISQSIENSTDELQDRKKNLIDLTAISSTSSSDSDDEEEISRQPAQLPPDSDEEMLDEDEEPTTYGRETQAILNSETQALDLDIPEPDGGFASSDEEDSDEGDEDDEADSNKGDEEDEDDLEGRDDQDLIDRQLQSDLFLQSQITIGNEQPDLNVPEPEGGFEPSGNSNAGNTQPGGVLQWAQSRWEHIVKRDREGLRADVIQQRSQVYIDGDEANLREEGAAAEEDELLEDAFLTDDAVTKEDALPEEYDDETILETPKKHIAGFTEGSVSDDNPLLVNQDTPSEVDEESETSSQAIDTFDDLAKPLLAKGYSLDSIFEAVHLTSANKVLLELLLEGLKVGHGIPQDVRGVWTEEDDADLQSGDSAAIQRVERKHGRSGTEGWKTRLRFLREEIESQEG
jgi:hypothetical protein